MSVNGLWAAPSSTGESSGVATTASQPAEQENQLLRLCEHAARPAALDPGSTLSAERVAAGHASRPSTRQSSGVRAASTAHVAGAHPPGMRTADAHQA